MFFNKTSVLFTRQTIDHEIANPIGAIQRLGITANQRRLKVKIADLLFVGKDPVVILLVLSLIEVSLIKSGDVWQRVGHRDSWGIWNLKIAIGSIQHKG